MVGWNFMYWNDGTETQCIYWLLAINSLTGKSVNKYYSVTDILVGLFKESVKLGTISSW